MFDIELLQNCYDDFASKKAIYNKMYEYYCGDTDAVKNYKQISNSSNNITNCNFLKKFVKEEVSYSVGNKLTYTSKLSNESMINDIEYYTAHFDENHDSDLMKTMLIHSIAYELYYIDNKNQFCSRIISPREGYALIDDFGNTTLFMHIFKKAFSEDIFIDVWDENEVIHYTEGFAKLGTNSHIFGIVPVGVSKISAELEKDTLYGDIRGLQDSYSTNLSDISNEISSFRAAYLAFYGLDVKDEDLARMRELGIMQIPTADGKVEFITKQINDSFIQNTLNTLEDKMYQLSCHINNNEAMQSNTSSLAIRARLISLEQKSKLNDGSINNCIKTRLEMLFIFLKFLKGKDYDYKDVSIKHTPCVPSDDVANANIVSQVGDVISKETSRGLFSFISNPAAEGKRVEKEQKKSSIGADLLKDDIKPTVVTE